MSTKIEWCDETWNPITGCTPCSPGCLHCYAKRMAQRLAGRYGYPKDDPFRVTFHPDKLDGPLKWKNPRRIFVCSMGDVFHDLVPAIWIDKIFARCRFRSEHTFIFLTKRPQKMAYQVNAHFRGFPPPPNVWLGITVCTQAEADEKIPILLRIPAAVIFVSQEPALEAIIYPKEFLSRGNRAWLILGQETGPGARPAKAEWFNDVIAQCRAAGVPVFVKKSPPNVPIIREFPNAK